MNTDEQRHDADAAVDNEPIHESAVPEAQQPPADAAQLQAIVEGALLAAGRPMSIAQLQELFDEAVRPDAAALRAALVAIAAACEGRAFELKEVASGFRFQVHQALGPWVSRLWDEKPQRYSRALLETLALIAYRQPITRADVEAVRGVAVSTNIIKTLQERDWVKVVGHKDVPGRPALYATTRAFLDYFNLKNLDELPPLAEIRDLDQLSGALDFGEAPLPAAAVAAMSAADANDEPDAVVDELLPDDAACDPGTDGAVAEHPE